VSNVVDELRADLSAEYQDLAHTLDAVAPNQWDAETPAPGWTIVDQLAHLVWSEVAAAQAAADPEHFVRWRDSLGGDFEPAVQAGLAQGRVLPPEELRERWNDASHRLIAAIATMSPGTRIPWFGPSMSAASMLSARLMETWAHGQDIVDTIAFERTPTRRLRHIAHLGVATRGWSYQVRNREPPQQGVYVGLRSPDGDLWEWGRDDHTDRVVGEAVDFCLVVTQRRHVRDTSLAVDGELAQEWMSIAQAFAGAPGPGRAPGSSA